MMAKDRDYIKLIHSTRWQRLRRDKLTADPMCERCKAEGRLTFATEVHHVVPVEMAITFREKERLMYDYHNLQALCHGCHSLTHKEMGRATKQQNLERSKLNIKGFVGKFL